MVKRVTKKIAAKLPAALQQEMRRWHSARLIRKGRFVPDEPEMRVISERVQPGDWLIDIGANIGYYTCHMSACAGPSGRVLAFEPILNTFALLAANVQAAGLNNVTLINAAASDGTGVLHMEVPQLDTGLDNLYEAHISNDGRHSVLSFALDSMSLPHRISLIKIDAEGHDLQVLRGAERLIANSKPLLIVESPDKGEIAEWIATRGYTVSKVDSRSPNMVAWPAVT